MGDAPRYLALRVIGSGELDHLLCVPLRLPEGATSIRELRRTVVIDQAEPTLDNVIVQGRLRVEWTYPVGHALWSTSAEESFALRIGVSGASPDCQCRVLDANVTGSSTTERRDCSVVRVSVQVLRLEEVQVTLQQPKRPAARSVITRFESRGR